MFSHICSTQTFVEKCVMKEELVSILILWGSLVLLGSFTNNGREKKNPVFVHSSFQGTCIPKLGTRADSGVPGMP